MEVKGVDARVVAVGVAASAVGLAVLVSTVWTKTFAPWPFGVPLFGGGAVAAASKFDERLAEPEPAPEPAPERVAEPGPDPLIRYRALLGGRSWQLKP